MNNSLSYEDFLEKIKNEIRELLPHSYSVNLHHIVKNNNVGLDGLLIREGDESLIPSIYLNDYFTEYTDGRPLSSIRDDVWSRYMDTRTHNSETPGFTFPMEDIRDRIILRIVNYEKNCESLKNSPHLRLDDLAVTYHILVNEIKDTVASIRITNENLELLKVDSSSLYSLALKNTVSIFPASIRPMEEILTELQENIEITVSSSFPIHMYVATNSQCINGATCILYPGLLDSFSSHIESDFYILPSSLHEVILLPKSNGTDITALNCMIKEVNMTQVPYEDILSDHAYLYSEIKEKINSLKHLSTADNLTKNILSD